MILVTGATGTIGRLLVHLLAAAGEPVRAVSRDLGRAGLPAGVDVVAADRPDMFDGVSSVLLNPRAVGTTAAELLELAAAAGVRRVVALAAINVDDDPARQPSRFRGDLNREVEAAAVASGLEWVSLRPTEFTGNAAGLWAGPILAGDVVPAPYALSESAPIDERDVAAVAARALVGEIAPGSRLVLTGPRSLTKAEQVATIGEVLGRPLVLREVPPEAARAALLGQGFPAGFVEALLAMQAAAVGRPAPTTTTVADVLGRPAYTFAEWTADHVDAFRPEPDRAGAR
jgi:uncharacterized protein YbjT (DUF2867 family)